MVCDTHTHICMGISRMFKKLRCTLFCCTLAQYNTNKQTKNRLKNGHQKI